MWLRISYYLSNTVALRKESVDRNRVGTLQRITHAASLSARRAWIEIIFLDAGGTESIVALRKESVDRNATLPVLERKITVALRKESVDRNICAVVNRDMYMVALRKESVDRNASAGFSTDKRTGSLSARRAWIEMGMATLKLVMAICRSPQGERG